MQPRADSSHRGRGFASFAVLHFVADEEDPAGLVRSYMASLPAGSFLAYTHVTDEVPGAVATLEQVYARANHRVYPRSVRAIEALATGSGLVVREPGIVRVTGWNAGEEIRLSAAVPPERMWLVGGVAQKPEASRS